MTQQTGPPTQYRPKGSGLGVGRSPLAEPVVSTLARVAELLGCDPVALAKAVAALEPWRHHHNGSAVYRFPELCEAAATAGIPVPATRPTMAAWQARPKRTGKRKAGPS